MSFSSNSPISQPSSQTWINKIKIVGSGHNRSVAPCEPFYLLDPDLPAPESTLTGAKNLIEDYGLKTAYQKFFRGNLKDDLSGFLPHLAGNVNMAASEDNSGLNELIEHPPICGKELLPFPPSQLDAATRLHPGPLPQEYMALFTAPPSSTTSNSANCNGDVTNFDSTSTAIPPSASSVSRKRRRDVHRASGVVTSATPVGPSAAAQLHFRNHNYQHPPSAASVGANPHSGPIVQPHLPLLNAAARPASGYFATPPPAAIRRSTEDFSVLGGPSSVESPGYLDVDVEARRKKKRKEKRNSSGRKDRID